MSIKWMSYVWENAPSKTLNGTDLVILLCLTDHMQDEDPRAWPSIARLSSRSGAAARTVQDSLTALEREGWIEREFRQGRSTIYHLRTPAVDRTPADVAPLRDTAPPTPAADRTEGVQPTAPTPAVHRTPPMRHTAPRTIKEPSEEPSEEPGGPRLLDGWHDDINDLAPNHSVTEWDAGFARCYRIGTEWADPITSLSRYLDWCRDKGHTPGPDRYVAWFTRDCQTNQQDAARTRNLQREQPRLMDAHSLWKSHLRGQS